MNQLSAATNPGKPGSSVMGEGIHVIAQSADSFTEIRTASLFKGKSGSKHVADQQVLNEIRELKSLVTTLTQKVGLLLDNQAITNDMISRPPAYNPQIAPRPKPPVGTYTGSRPL